MKREAVKNITLKFGETVKYWNSAAVGLVFPKGGPHPIFSSSLSLLGWYRGWSLLKKDVLMKFDAFCEFTIVMATDLWGFSIVFHSFDAVSRGKF